MSNTPVKIELLAPARNVEIAIDAINHGADAVYIGASRFGARQAAGNTVEDISRVVEYAHIFGVKIYVTLNTILYDDELSDVETLIAELYNIGVDAIIVQDMGILRLNIPPIPLHASTQMDNRTSEKVDFLFKTGFEQIVLARELSLKDISEIHKAVPGVRLEAFVHGALCVSYSGKCYASQYCFGRSANRGVCAQFCRLPFNLVDVDGKVILEDKHLLSLKDMNRSDVLEQMLDAGITSLKIEGRLKDSSYVKNITAYYRERLDEIFARRSEYVRTSWGVTKPQFTPSPDKSFNRGGTHYFLNDRNNDITSFYTPKSLGEKMGKVVRVAKNHIIVSGTKQFANGDGVCFIDHNDKLQGFRINRVEGDMLFPQVMPEIKRGVYLFRNYNSLFEREVARSSVPRKIGLFLQFDSINGGYRLTARDESGIIVSVDFPSEKVIAHTPQRDNLLKQLKKWGNTSFEVIDTVISFEEEFFIPSSFVADMRRWVCEQLLKKHKESYVCEKRHLLNCGNGDYFEKSLNYTANVSNNCAKDFYKTHNVDEIEPAFELKQLHNVPIMYCKHCIKYSMGWCSKSGTKHSFKEPFFLLAGDGRRFRLNFDCKNCMMLVMGGD